MHKISCASAIPSKLAAAALGAAVASLFAGFATAENGQITPATLEIDGDMFAAAPLAALQGAGSVDWVADADEPNAGSGCLDAQGIVLCNEPNVTAHPQGQGTWNGVRIIDGLADQDNVFLGSSKFDQPQTWLVGAGNVGSTKYDANEVYLANNEDTLYFAMLRHGNNGSTTFDFEFNREAPSSTYVPTRTDGDVLLTFEMSGSGKSGTVAILAFRWDQGQWVELPVPPGAIGSINDADVEAPPWGTRDQKGNWSASDLRRFTFAEVSLDIGPGGIQLPFDPDNCSQSAWVGPRTRASPQFTSDMKDAFPIINYEFSGLAVAAAKTGESAQDLTMTVGSIVDGNATTTKQWQVFNDQTQAWENMAGKTGDSLTLAHDDPAWTYPYATTKLVNTPFSVAGTQFVGQILSTRVRVAATQSINANSCTLESNAVTVEQLLAVDP